MEEVAPGGGVYLYIVAAGLHAHVDGAAIDPRQGVAAEDVSRGTLGSGLAVFE
jgi:hypothetical protein